ncbi:MAG: extracellular solute-binding protein, partial [Clostridia bacterium]|nr:extracellular solute-binding protein [Clostridia bacterium]
MKRSISMLLLIAMLAGMTACGESGGGNTVTETTSGDTTTAEPVEAGIPEPELPVKDYGGEEFTFLIRGEGSGSYRERWVYAEEENGEVVNDAVFRRNQATEEKFNIKIKTIEPSWSGGWANELENMARQYIQAGDPEIDVISSMRSSLGALAREGMLYNFHDLDSVNLTAPYWDANAVEHMTLDGNLFMMPSDISMGNLSMARFFYFNKRYIDEYKLEDPYTLVEDNKWTLDKMLEMVTRVSVDVNGDSQFNENDYYGMLTDDSANGSFITILAGTGIRMVELDKSGGLISAIMSEKVQTVLEKCKAVFDGTDYSISSEELIKLGDGASYANGYDYGRKLFADGHFLFYNSGISSMSQFRDMKDDFGIVPNPKYDEKQDGYYHKLDKYALIFGVPVTAGDMERVGAVLEYMSWYSNKSVLPAYYETTVKAKRIRDDHAAEMLDLIKQSMLYDFSDLYNLRGDAIIWNAYTSGNLASTWDSSKSAFETKLA